MPDTRSSRGPHPRDLGLFAPAELPRLATALDELCWLLDRGYSRKASLALVGDRHQLRQRQRTALHRCAASAAEAAERRSREVPADALAGSALGIDGYNVLLTLEVALSGGVVLAARDGAFRDMASMTGHYRRVDQTAPALELLGAFLAGCRVATTTVFLDRPVSNSGRLRTQMLELAAARGWCWEVELAASPDRSLARWPGVVASADSAVLDRCGRWFNLARRVVETGVEDAWIVEPGGGR